MGCGKRAGKRHVRDVRQLGGRACTACITAVTFGTNDQEAPGKLGLVVPCSGCNYTVGNHTVPLVHELRMRGLCCCSMPLLKPGTFDYGTLSSGPDSAAAIEASELPAAAADAEPPSQREHAEALLAGLPGIRREGRPEPPELLNSDPFAAPPPLKVYESPPLHSEQVPLDEWELRAIMEKRRRKEQQHAGAKLQRFVP